LCVRNKTTANKGIATGQDFVIFGCGSLSASVSADVILLVISSKLQLLFINLASVPGGQLVNSQTAAILERQTVKKPSSQKKGPRQL